MAEERESKIMKEANVKVEVYKNDVGVLTSKFDMVQKTFEDMKRNH